MDKREDFLPSSRFERLHVDIEHYSNKLNNVIVFLCPMIPERMNQFLSRVVFRSQTKVEKFVYNVDDVESISISFSLILITSVLLVDRVYIKSAQRHFSLLIQLFSVF